MLAVWADSPEVGALERGLSSLGAAPSSASSEQILQGTGRPSVTIRGVGP
jgi:hypothetical protein